MKEIGKTKGVLIWVTGLPGSGKTIFADALADELRKHITVIRIDGDCVREVMGGDLGYSVADRITNAYRIARLNKYIVDQGNVVICSTVSLYREIHEWNKLNIPLLIDVYIDVPPEILYTRDKKQLYSKAEADVVGIHQGYDIPVDPAFTIINDGDIESFFANIKPIAQAAILKQ